MFNEELKKRFMNNYDESTQFSLSFIFKKSAELEKMLDKDIYEFNRKELDELFMSFGCRTEASVASRFSIIGKYIDFAIEQGFVPSGINLVKNFVGHEYYKRYVSKVAKHREIMTKEEFDNLLEFCVNAQDRTILILPYVGVRGRQIQDNSLEEMRNLRWEDINENDNTLTLRKDNGETRVIPVSSATIEILRDAYNQEKYIKNNGEVTDWMQVRKNTEMELLNTGYILKPTKKGEFGKITKGIINQRLNTIKRLYGNPFITITNIWLSGMIEYGKQIKKEKGSELDREGYKEICRRFGHDEVYWCKIKQRIQKYI